MSLAGGNDPRMDAYRVIKQVGKGSYGQVYLVKNSDTKKQYVVKKIKLTASSAKERLAAEQEAALLSRLHHPNIVSYKESFQDSHGVLHIVMGYCEGGDLCTRLKTYGGRLLPETQVVEWFVQIALALQYLHDRKILHRDLKTQNIFLSKNDIIKVGDLGIARVLDGSCELANTVIGTPYYMSPELFSNQPYNHKSDIWALGCCVYEMATLKHAFTARNINALMYKILQGKVPPLPTSFSSELTQLVQVMMSSNAADRPSVHQILRMPFVREHIKMFLDRTASKRKRAGSSQQKPPAPTRNRVNSQGSSSTSQSQQDIRRRSSSIGSTNSTREERSASVERDEPSLDRPMADQPPVGVTKSNSLSQMTQQGDKNSDRPRMKENERKQIKAPRPLPPNPAQKATHSPVNRVPVSKPPANKASVSSARERRRRSKQEGGRGRVVLKSRSAADLCKKVDKCEVATPPEKVREGVDEPDSGVAVEKGRVMEELQSGKRVMDKLDSKVKDECGSGRPTDLGHHEEKKEGVSSSSISSRKQIKRKEEKVDKEALRLACDAELNDGHSCDGAVPSLNGHSSDEVEVDEFFTLLDTTLHLPDSPVSHADFDSEDHPGPPVTAFSTEQVVPEEGGRRQLPPGRLADRIKALREECIRELGETKMNKAYQLLDKVDPEQAEEVLLSLLGKDAAFSFTGKLQQLKLCEDSLYEL